MATERLSMRQTREILRQKWRLGRTHREVAQSLGISCGAVGTTVLRARAAGLPWAQVEALDDEALHARVYGPPTPQKSTSPVSSAAAAVDSLPDLEYKRVVSCKDSFHGTDVLAVSEHGAPGRRPNIHTHFVGRQREDGLDTLPARAAEGNRTVPGPGKRRSQAVRERKTSVLRACRGPNP